MLTKSDFQKAIRSTISDYPTIAPLFQAGDPRIHQHLDAMAAMLAMFSEQLEVAQTEQFDKSRDGTILADAAMRGIVRKGRAARVTIRAVNSGTEDFAIESGRNLFDSSGRYWRVETACTVPAGSEAFFEASQQRSVKFTHTVSGAQPFYAIQIPESEEGDYVCGLRLKDAEGEYAYRSRYTNAQPGELIYHVEADDRQRLFIRLGFKDVVGTQPTDGHQFSIDVSYTNGDVAVDFGSPFAFEYVQQAEEASIEMTMQEMLSRGEDPISMTVLRDIAKYPAIYRDEAVFLGEFGFLVRKNFPSLQFLSVWNETMEEQARGPSVDNVNVIFVACLSADGTEKTVTQIGDEVPEPEEITGDALTQTQREIERLILRADDSYRVRFFTPVLSKIGMKISARVAASYRSSDIREKIREAILGQYGKASAAAKRGQQQPLYRDVYDLLKSKIPALTDGEADLEVVIETKDTGKLRPELWKFVDETSLEITCEMTNIVVHSWGG